MNTLSQPAAKSSPAPVDRVPVSLLTGFLGAGKTTLLNHWVRRPEMAGVAVLVNEFGEVGIDHHLVDKVDDQLMLLDSGCLCCAMQGDLIGALKSLALRGARREIAPITRVVVETTGLADPVPVIYTLMEEAFVAARYVCDGVVTAVSANQGLAQLRDFAEATRQVVVADRLLITKCDRAGSSELAALERELQRLNPGAPRRQIRNGVVGADVLLTCGIYGASGKPPSVQEWLGEEALRQADRETRNGSAVDWLGRLDLDIDLAPGETEDGEASAAAAGGRYLPERWRERRDRQAADAERAAAPHSPGVFSFVLTFEQPVSWFGFAVTLGQILRRHGAGLLRVKGLVSVAGEARPQVIQCVQGVAYPSVRLPRWPDEGPFRDRRGRLVFIARDLSDEQVEAIRSACVQLPGDPAALRTSAGDLTLPTRCWLSQRMPVTVPDALRHDGWFVQTRRLGSRVLGG